MAKSAPYDRSRERNPFWKGGRSIASNGYVLVKVGTEHHLADVRGYAYEHRLEAENKLGRRLLPGEEVHHKDEDKKNNAHDNLVVASSPAEHHALHRKGERGLRQPGEENPAIVCACGCGETLAKLDDYGRPREYVSGHNPQPAPTRDAVLGELRSGFANARMIALATGRPLQAVKVCLSKLKKVGVVKNECGIWSLVAGEEPEMPEVRRV